MAEDANWEEIVQYCPDCGQKRENCNCGGEGE
jgi:hypothetical protein